MDPAKALRVWMAEKDLSAKQVASLVGCVAGTIWAIRRGRTRPHLRTAVEIERITEGLIPACSWHTEESP